MVSWTLLLLFFLGWWNDVAIVWFIGWAIPKHGEMEIGLAAILLYAALTRNIAHVPDPAILAVVVLTHITCFFTFFSVYTSTQKKTSLMVGAGVLSILPNYENPFLVSAWRRIARLLVYGILMWRLKKSQGLEVSKYFCYAWVLFSNECSMVIVPFQIVYDTYYYKLDTSV